MKGQEYTNTDYSIVALDKFIQATRDSGYQGTASAVSELLDNSLQAGATEIRITLTVEAEDSRYPIVMRIHDNGCGMDGPTLRQALRFGGSTRFNDRSGLGRYGMGLPNSSFSQAQRVTVHTWTSPECVLWSYLDLDEIASGALKEVPPPQNMKPTTADLIGNASGTIVTWHRCDRLDNRRISTLIRKLLTSIGRKFRHHIWKGTQITVNGEIAEAIDPLYLQPNTMYSGASQFGDESVYEIQVSPDDPKTGLVSVRFSELPVAEWSKLSNKEKNARGIAKGAGVSVIRAGREVDYGWFFLSGKRRENYDDWWRCEVQFDPILDEAFGITHTKQQIRPQPHLIEALSPDIEATARALNNRARKAHTDVKVATQFSESEELARERDELLTPLPKDSRDRDKQVLDKIGKRPKQMCTSVKGEESKPPQTTEYKIIPQRLNETTFFNYARENGRLILILNPDHPFFKQVYKPLLDSDGSREGVLRAQLDLLLLSAARNEALLDCNDEVRLSEAYRKGWSDTLATFLNG